MVKSGLELERSKDPLTTHGGKLAGAIELLCLVFVARKDAQHGLALLAQSAHRRAQ